MKFLILNLVIFLIFVSTVEAQNRCESSAFKEDNICIISGGSANTNRAINRGHARSLALKTARLLAYEKMAEKIKGVIISSTSMLDNEVISSSKVKSIISASLKNITIEKESVAFLSDGSPWAEVTLSTPKKGKMGVETKVLEFINGARSQTTNTEDSVTIIDLTNLNYSKSHFFKISSKSKVVFSFNTLMGDRPKFLSDVTNLPANSKINRIVPQSLDGSNIILCDQDAERLILSNYKFDLIKNNKIIFLTN